MYFQLVTGPTAPCNPCILETPKGVPGAFSDNPDEMSKNAALHHGLHCLLRQKRFSEKKIKFYLAIITCDSLVGLPILRNLVNVYTRSSNRNNSVYTKLPD